MNKFNKLEYEAQTKHSSANEVLRFVKKRKNYLIAFGATVVIIILTVHLFSDPGPESTDIV